MSLRASPEVLRSLDELRRAKKYIEEDFYPGAPTEEIRTECERKTNDFLDEAIAALTRGTTKEELFRQAEQLLQSFEDEDTEEREKVGDYVGSLMQTVGIHNWTDFV